MSKVEKMLKLRQEFKSNDVFWEAIVLFRRWAYLTGDIHTSDAVDRFLKFMEDDNAP